MSMNFRSIIRRSNIKLKCEQGQGLAEYVLVIFLFAIAMMFSFTSFTTALQTLYATIRAAFP